MINKINAHADNDVYEILARIEPVRAQVARFEFITG